MSIISPCSVFAIRNAAHTLLTGNLVAFPTETVYGLGADATNQEAIARIYVTKGRPVEHPLIVHMSSIEFLDKWATNIPEFAIRLARNYWPGPMTLVLPRTELAKDFISGGQDNIGLRVPSNSIALALLKEFEIQGGMGVAAPSANRFGAVSPTSAKAVEIELGNFLHFDDQILDGGICEVGIESTIIDCTHDAPRVLRPGVITAQMIEEITELPTESSVKVGQRKIRVSGSLASHYAPKASVILDEIPEPGQGYIALANFPTPNMVIRLAAPKTNTEFARSLYSALRAADTEGLKSVVIKQPDGDGIAFAIRDRLSRAANNYS
jgi:L-threonylcarbamoyladenylate synthase